MSKAMGPSACRYPVTFSLGEEAPNKTMTWRGPTLIVSPLRIIAVGVNVHGSNFPSLRCFLGAL